MKPELESISTILFQNENVDSDYEPILMEELGLLTPLDFEILSKDEK